MKMKNIISFLFSILILSSCKPNIKKWSKNENIPKEIKSEIDKLNTLLIRSIKNNTTKEIKTTFSEKLINKIGISEIDSLFNQISPLLKNEKFKEMDSYYVINTNSNVSNTILSGTNEKIDYNIVYRALNEKMFISLFKTTTLQDNLLLSLIYGLDEKGMWKLNIFHVGQYEVFGKTLPEYYSICKAEYENQNLINAANNLHAGKQVMSPANEIFNYQIENKFIELEKEIFSLINKNYHFPIIEKSIKTKPEIFLLYPQRTDEDFSPMIRYKTSINLKNIESLKKENLEVQKKIESIFKGITTNSKYIFYRAYSEFPDEKGKEYDYYGFVQELK